MRKIVFVLCCVWALVTTTVSALPPLPTGLATDTVNCESDGLAGKRIQLVYLYPAGTKNNYGARLAPIRAAANLMDNIWDKAADPYDQHPRWACYAQTKRPIVRTVKGPSIGSDGVYTFTDVVRAMQRSGHTSQNRVYLIFADSVAAAFRYGGQSTTDNDDRRTIANLNNLGPSYALVDASEQQWQWSRLALGALHELGHTLGAVQCSAPHSSCPAGEAGHHHCWDEYDVMCYADGGSYYSGHDGVQGNSDDRQPAVRCDEGSSLAEQWDCGKNDYYNIAPAAGSYLATHWNLAISSFVTRPRPE